MELARSELRDPSRRKFLAIPICYGTRDWLFPLGAVKSGDEAKRNKENSIGGIYGFF